MTNHRGPAPGGPGVVTALLAAALGFVAFFIGYVVVFFSAVTFAAEALLDDGDAQAAMLVLATTVASAAGAAATAFVLGRRGDRGASPTMISWLLVGLWPLVFGVVGLFDGRGPLEPAWQAPTSALLGLATAALVGRGILRR